MNYLVRTGALLGFPELVEELGHSPLDLLQGVGLPPSVLSDADLYIPYPALAALLTLAAQRCHAPDFGVRLGGRQGLEVVGALGSWLCLQQDFADALALMQKSLAFHARGVEVKVDIDGGQLLMSLTLAFAQQTDARQLLSMSTALLARCVAQLHGPDAPRPDVSLAVPRPRQPAAWRTVFGRLPAFDAPICRLAYPANLVDRPIRVDASLREQLAAQWRNSWEYKGQPALRAQVERAIVALLPTGDCSLEHVARLVGMHPRTLQTRLKHDALSFGQLLRSVREALAREHLTRSDVDLSSLAMRLGFGELATFSRAFKAWTGLAPQAWRAASRSS